MAFLDRGHPAAGAEAGRVRPGRGLVVVGVLAPFGLATAWWTFADSIGLTQRRAMDKMEKTKAERRNRNLEALGMGPRRDRKARRASEIPADAAVKRSAKD